MSDSVPEVSNPLLIFEGQFKIFGPTYWSASRAGSLSHFISWW
jgi:hypothetical protein